MLWRALDAMAAKPASRLPEVVGTLETRVGFDRAMASCATADAKRLG